jgi:hypothetical protein
LSHKRRNRTPFARWMWEHGLKPRDLEQPLQKSFEAIRTYALDYDDPNRVIPSPATMALITALTDGVVRPGHFYEPSPERVPEDVQ